MTVGSLIYVPYVIMFKKAMYIYDAHDYTLISFFFCFLFVQQVRYSDVHIRRNSHGPAKTPRGRTISLLFALTIHIASRRVTRAGVFRSKVAYNLDFLEGAHGV